MIRTVFFDVGGTLHTVHHDPGLAEEFSRQLLNRLADSEIFLPITPAALAPLLKRNAEEYKRQSEQTRVELPNLRIWNEFYLKDFSIGEARLAPLAETLSVLYDACRVRNCPRPKLRETIAALHDMGLAQGIISNIISTTFVPQILEDYDIAPYFSCVVMSSAAGIRKPDPGIFQMAAEQIGVPLGEMAYVGDTLSRDVLGCRNAGVGLCIQISNPAIAHRDAAFVGTGLAPDVHIEALSEIPGIISAQNSGN